MQVHVKTDNHIESHQGLIDHIAGVVESVLEPYADRITRVEVHVSDQNAGKTAPDDKRCVMEARLEGQKPLAVTSQASTVHEAVDSAADKLRRSVESHLGRLYDRR